jgi:hypothetical protein
MKHRIGLAILTLTAIAHDIYCHIVTILYAELSSAPNIDIRSVISVLLLKRTAHISLTDQQQQRCCRSRSVVVPCGIEGGKGLAMLSLDAHRPALPGRWSTEELRAPFI